MSSADAHELALLRLASSFGEPRKVMSLKRAIGLRSALPGAMESDARLGGFGLPFVDTVGA